jgi:L-cysteine S-thiosulfotransferase
MRRTRWSALRLLAVRSAAILVALVLGAPATAAAEETSLPDGPSPRKSGIEFIGESTRALQRDDTLNPAMLWVGGGETLWNAVAGKAGKSCAGCHGDAASSMRGVAARHPAFDPVVGRTLTLSSRINLCRETRQQAPPLAAEGEDLLGLESFVALQSRGLPLAPPQDEGTRASAASGRALYFQRIGQLNLSCAQCHDRNWGGKLAGATIPQGHANAYPVYRLEWQAMGSLQRRLRNCMSGVRAQVPAFDAQELVDLEAYLAERARGMPLETPGVRP